MGCRHVLIKLNAETHVIWKEQIKLMLEGKGIEIYILDEPPIKIITTLKDKKLILNILIGRKVIT